MKTFRPKGILDMFRYLFLPSPARIERDNALEARKRDVAAPRPLAVGERRRFGFLVQSTLVMGAVNGKPLDEVMETREDGISRSELLTKLGRFVKAMHDRGMRHDDLHPGNILVSGGEDLGSFTLVDIREAGF
ncbi:MAG: lipopolysaccharide kinase InaA family protein, partial [Planctomycetota bacterium]